SGSEPAASLATLKREVESAMHAASDRLKPFGSQLLAEIDRRGPAKRESAVESGWQVVDSGSFCVLHKGRADFATEVARTAEAALLDGALPSEVTQVVLADLFADEPLPRWAIVGMAALAESPEGVARYRRSVPALLREKKLFAVGPFMDRADFPDAASVTPFY